MYLEALILVFFATSYLGSESDNNSNFGYIGENIYLTPETLGFTSINARSRARYPAYVRFIKEKPLQLMEEMTRYKTGWEFLAVTKRIRSITSSFKNYSNWLLGNSLELKMERH